MLAQQILNGLVSGANYAVVAMGLTLVYSILGVPNFSHGALYMLGGFITLTAATAGIPVILALLVAMASVAVVGIGIDWSTFKPLRHQPHVALLIASFAVGVVIEGAALLVWGAESRTIDTAAAGHVVRFAGLSLSLIRAITLVAAIVLIVVADHIVRRTALGRSMRAVEQNPLGAAVSGINIDRVHRGTMAVSSALAAAAGGLAGMAFTVDVTMGFVPVVKAFVIVIAGGLGSIPGTILAAMILSVTESLGSAYLGSGWSDIFGFAALIVILVLRPRGLFGRKALR